MIKDILINRNIIENKNITHEGLMVYVGLLCMSNGDSPIYASTNIIELSLKNNNFKFNKAIKDKIKNGLVNFEDNDLIKTYSCEGNISKLKPKDEIIIIVKVDNTYDDVISIHIDDIRKLMDYNGKVDIDKLLKYFIVVASTIMQDTKVGNESINILADKSCISDNVIKVNYNNVLDKLELIYVYKYNCGNFYGLYKDKEIVNAFAEKHKNDIIANKGDLDRNYNAYTHFVEDTMFRDDYTCKCCSTRGGKLNVHHLNGYNWDIANRINVDNGITLCESCHKEFHNKYGRGNNTKEQFEEFLALPKI